MAVSEALYGITTSYVSSSAYYGFVPQNNHNHHQPGGNCGNSSWDVNVNMKQARNGNSQQAGAMETDDDSHDVDLVNNYCVIPEALRGINPAVYHSNYLDGHNNTVPGFVGALDRQFSQDAGRRRNRKRNNDGELMPVELDQLKRLRKGSGNSGTYHGRGFPKDGGLAKVYYKSSRLCINRGNYIVEDKEGGIKDDDNDDDEEEDEEEEELATVESCCWAAGNHTSLVNEDDKDKDLLSNGNLKLRRDFLVGDLEYEKMLLETHGCSVYHHQIFQSEHGISESEF